MSELLDKLKAVFVSTPSVKLWRTENNWHFFAETFDEPLLLAVIVPGDGYFLIKGFMAGYPLDQITSMKDVVAMDGEVRTYQTLEKVLMVMNFLRSKVVR